MDILSIHTHTHTQKLFLQVIDRISNKTALNVFLCAVNEYLYQTDHPLRIILQHIYIFLFVGVLDFWILSIPHLMFGLHLL